MNGRNIIYSISIEHLVQFRTSLRNLYLQALSNIYTEFLSVQASHDECVTIQSTLDLPVDRKQRTNQGACSRQFGPSQIRVCVCGHMDLDVDGDGNWIIDALVNGTLAVAHDGSFNEHVNRSVCSAGLVLLCTSTRKLATVSWAERTGPAGTATNYRGELLRGLPLALI